MTTTELWLVAHPLYQPWHGALTQALAAAGTACRALEAAQAPGLVRRLATGLVDRPAGLLYLGLAEDATAEILNRACCAVGLPLILLGTPGGQLQLGPAVRAGQGACLACYRSYAEFFVLDRAPGPAHPPAPPDQALAGWLAGQIAGQLAPLSAGPLAQGSVARFDAGAPDWFRPLRDPLCPVCSPSARYPAEVIQAFQYHAEAAHEDPAAQRT